MVPPPPDADGFLRVVRKRHVPTDHGRAKSKTVVNLAEIGYVFPIVRPQRQVKDLADVVCGKARDCRRVHLCQSVDTSIQFAFSNEVHRLVRKVQHRVSKLRFAWSVQVDVSQSHERVDEQFRVADVVCSFGKVDHSVAQLVHVDGLAGLHGVPLLHRMLSTTASELELQKCVRGCIYSPLPQRHSPGSNFKQLVAARMVQRLIKNTFLKRRNVFYELLTEGQSERFGGPGSVNVDVAVRILHDVTGKLFKPQRAVDIFSSVDCQDTVREVRGCHKQPVRVFKARVRGA